MVGQYYDLSQPCECCSSLSFRGRNRKCWIWNYFRCSHCRVYRINWYNNAKKISWNYNCWPILWSIPNSAASEAGTGNAESEILTSSAAARPLQTLPNKLIQQQRSFRIIGTFYIPKRKNSWNHHKEGTHRKILTRKIKNTRKHNTPYYYLLDAFVYLLNNCCDTQFINFSASNWKKMIHELNVIREK